MFRITSQELAITRSGAQGVAGSNPVAPTTFRVHRSQIGHSPIFRSQRSLRVARPADEHCLFAGREIQISRLDADREPS
jgi:hypothetical protein